MNNEAKFDPMTGKPIENSIKTEQNNINSIATVDQSNENFINNVQTESQNKNIQKEEKKSYLFIIILFIIIFIAIFFLFPLINKYI